MFELLDEFGLKQLATLDDRSTLNTDVQLVQVTACLEAAAKECAMAFSKGVETESGESYFLVESGILAAQRIIAKSSAGNADIGAAT